MPNLFELLCLCKKHNRNNGRNNCRRECGHESRQQLSVPPLCSVVERGPSAKEENCACKYNVRPLESSWRTTRFTDLKSLGGGEFGLNTFTSSRIARMIGGIIRVHNADPLALSKTNDSAQPFLTLFWNPGHAKIRLVVGFPLPGSLIALRSSAHTRSVLKTT